MQIELEFEQVMEQKCRKKNTSSSWIQLQFLRTVGKSNLPWSSHESEVQHRAIQERKTQRAKPGSNGKHDDSR